MDRSLSDSWTGFTKFTPLNEKLPERYMWSGERLAETRATTRPDLWPAMWSGMSKAAQRKEQQRWAIDKSKLDNARKLRRIYFVDPDGGEVEETIRNTHGKVGDSDGGGYAL